MPRTHTKQQRRGVSMSRGHYLKLKRLSRVAERSMSSMVERFIDDAIDRLEDYEAKGDSEFRTKTEEP